MDLGESFDVSKLMDTVQYLLDNEENHLVVDLGDLESLPEEALQTFRDIQRNVASEDGKFGILAPREKIRSLLHDSGIGKLVPIYEQSQDIGKAPAPVSTPEAEKPPPAPPSEPVGSDSKSDTDENLIVDDEDNLQDILIDDPAEEAKSGLSVEEEEEIPLIPLNDEENREEMPSPRSKSSEDFQEIELEPLADEDMSFSSEQGEQSPAVPRANEADEKILKEETEKKEEPVARKDKPSQPEPPPASGNRVGARDRLNSPSSRKPTTKARGGRAWASTSDVEKTGVVFVDDTVEGEVINKEELEKEAQRGAAFTGQLETKSSSKGLIIVLILVLAVIGGLVYLLKDSAKSFVFQDEVDKPYVPEVQQEEVPPIVQEEPAEEEAEEVQEEEKEVVKEKKAPVKKVVKKTKPAVKRKPTPPRDVSIAVASTPSGATVYVNGSRAGKTPVSIDLKRSSNKIVMQLDGYEDYRTTVRRSTKGKRIIAKLQKKGSASVKSEAVEPEFSDEEPEDKTKTTAKAESSKEQEEPVAEKKGEEKKVEPVKEKPPEKEIKTAALQQKPPIEKPKESVKEIKKEPELEDKPKEEPKQAMGAISKIFIASKPPGADIFVNGKKQNGITSPAWLELPAGKYNVLLKKDGTQAEKEILIKEGKNKSQYLMLK